MAAEHDFINSLLAPHVTPKPVDWRRATTAMDGVAGTQSEASREVLLKILRFDGDLQVRVIANHPHLLTPLESLQAQALQALAAWGGESCAAIEEFAERTESETLEVIASSCLIRRRR